MWFVIFVILVCVCVLFFSLVVRSLCLFRIGFSICWVCRWFLWSRAFSVPTLYVWAKRVVCRSFFSPPMSKHTNRKYVQNECVAFHWPICRKTMMFVSVPVVDIILFSFAWIFQSAHHKQLYPYTESFGLIWRDCIHKKMHSGRIKCGATIPMDRSLFRCHRRCCWSLR